MKTEKILDNSLTLMMGEGSSGKTIAISAIIKAYLKRFKGCVYTYGMNKITEALRRQGHEARLFAFHSMIEFENITNSIIIADEFKSLIDIEDRKKKKQLDTSLRLVFHNNNKILLVGHPSDFNKYLCSKAGCFIFKSLNIADLINGTTAKDIIMNYEGDGKGMHRYNLPVNQMLCFKGKVKENKEENKLSYWVEYIGYDKSIDTKIDNVDLFCARNVQKKCNKSTNIMGLM